MIISYKELTALYTEFKDVNEELVEHKLEAIESLIRSYTNNNFQNRQVRAYCSAKDNILTFLTGNWLFRQNDTIQLDDNGLNNKLCVVKEISDSTLEITSELYPSDKVLVTKIQYPKDIIEGSLNLLRWDCFERGKNEGVASESISRHSISYVAYDGTNTIGGYPAKMFGFCKPYMRIKC